MNDVTASEHGSLPAKEICSDCRAGFYLLPPPYDEYGMKCRHVLPTGHEVHCQAWEIHVAAQSTTPSRAHDLADAIIERVLNLDEYSSPDDDPDLLLVKRNKLHFIIRDESTDEIERLTKDRDDCDRDRHALVSKLIADNDASAAALSAKDARIAELESEVSGLMEQIGFDPEMQAQMEADFADDSDTKAVDKALAHFREVDGALCLEKSEAEIARLREALTKIADDTVYLPRNSSNVYTQVIVRMQETARAALRQEPGQ